jgi:hypothetical protein
MSDPHPPQNPQPADEAKDGTSIGETTKPLRPAVAGTMPSSAVAKLAGQVPESSAAKLVREAANLPFAKLARQVADSSTTNSLRGIVESPTTKLARSVGLPSHSGMTEMAATTKMLA